MLITSHIAATTAVLIGAEALGADLNLPIITASYILGVGIDLDHPLFYWRDSVDRLKEYKRNRKNFKLGEKNLHSVMQEPVAFIAIFLISLVIYLINNNSAVFIPVICFGVHIAMDLIIDFDNQLLWPISKKTYRGPFKQKIYLEGVVGSILSIILIIFFLNQLNLI